DPSASLLVRGGTPMEKLLDRVAALEGAMQELRDEREATKRRLNRCRGLATVLALMVVVGLAPRTGQADPTLASLATRVTALEAKLKYLTTSGTSMYITGANLFIRNGTGATNMTNGLGNLTIGYNELRPLNPGGADPNARTGSHNLVVGTGNNYSSAG